MADVFDGVPIFDHTGQRRDVAYLRSRYGPYLTAVWPGFTLLEIRETEAQMTHVDYWQKADGSPDVGREVLYAWPDGVVPVRTDDQGRANWVLGSDTWIDPSGQNQQHAKGPYTATSGPVHIEGIGWAGGTNHANPGFHFRAGGSIPPEPPNPPTDGVLLTQAEAQEIFDSATRIEQIIFAAMGRS